MKQKCHDCGARLKLPEGVKPMRKPIKHRDGTVTKVICPKCRGNYAGIDPSVLTGWSKRPRKTGRLSYAALDDLLAESKR